MPNLYISNVLPPYRVDLCNELHERLGCKICHFMNEVKDSCFSIEEVNSRIRFANHIVPVRRVMGRTFLRAPEKLLDSDTHIVFVNEYSPVALQMLSLRKKYGFKLVSFCDDSMDLITGNDFSRFHSLARHVFPQIVDEIIVHNKEVANWYKARFGKGIVMPIIADDKLMRDRLVSAIPLSESIRVKYGLTGKRVMMFVGRLVDLKNLPRFFEAFLPFQDKARLVIVGEGEERENLERLAASLGLDVIFTGPKYGEELLAWYNIADILALPSTREAFGAVTGEALICGCRVLVSSRAGSASLVEDGKNGIIVNPLIVDSIHSALSRLLDMPALPRDSYGLRPTLLQTSFRESFDAMLTGLPY